VLEHGLHAVFIRGVDKLVNGVLPQSFLFRKACDLRRELVPDLNI
jgi:hypothetical protein